MADKKTVLDDSNWINLKVDSSELDKFMVGLRADLSKVSDEVRKIAVDIIDLLPDLVLVESRGTGKLTTTVSIKPSKRFIALREAINTGNFDGFGVNKSIRKVPASVLAKEFTGPWLSIGYKKVADVASLVMGEVKDHPAVPGISKSERDVITKSSEE
ncbi:hypothetical protein [Nitrosomonas communis]|uniref:hypothetical protein n=1 Tax=Nitrosomonas communis TaxID=44574 RepID=UPI003D291395